MVIFYSRNTTPIALPHYDTHDVSVITLSKKRSQEESYEVRGQSDVCHTSVIFMPAFPWYQMGGKFSRKLVSTLSYLLYTCLCQEILKWYIFFLKFPICSPRMLCEQLQAICLIPLKLRHHVIMFFPMQKFIVLPSHYIDKSMNGLLPPSTNGGLPPSMNGGLPPSTYSRCPPSLDVRLVSSLSRCTAGVLPLSTNGWHPPSLDEQPCPSLGRWAPLPRRTASAGILPLSTNGWRPPSLDEWLASSLLNEWPRPSLG